MRHVEACGWRDLRRGLLADMGKTYKELMAELSPERRERVDARAQELIAEEKSPRDLSTIATIAKFRPSSRAAAQRRRPAKRTRR